MLKHLKAILPGLELLTKLTVDERQQYIKVAKSKFIKQFIDLLYNISIGRFSLTKRQVKELKRFKLKLTTLFKSDLPFYKRRDILSNRLFFARLVPIVTKIILAYYETF